MILVFSCKILLVSCEEDFANFLAIELRLRSLDDYIILVVDFDCFNREDAN